MVPRIDSCHGGGCVSGREGQTVLKFPDGTARTLAEFIRVLPDGADVTLAPGRYEGPILIERQLTLRGAGDLTRIRVHGPSRAFEIHAPGREVVIESVLIEGAHGGVLLKQGRLRLYNVHIQRCRSEDGGGAIRVVNGTLDALRLRMNDLVAGRGGAVSAEGEAILRLRESQIESSEALQGGAVSVAGRARVALEAVTVRKARARTLGGGQAVYVEGDGVGAPVVELRKVRLADVPLAPPVVVRTSGRVTVHGCDLPRVVLGAQGVVDGGENVWR